MGLARWLGLATLGDIQDASCRDSEWCRARLHKAQLEGMDTANALRVQIAFLHDDIDALKRERAIPIKKPARKRRA